jgi:hypothetical protein
LFNAGFKVGLASLLEPGLKGITPEAFIYDPHSTF